MKSRYAVFQCNKCDKSVNHTVMIAESATELEDCKKALRPPFAEFSNDSLVKQFDCLVADCDGFINIIFVETNY